MIYTFSAYNDRRPLIAHLKEALESKGFELKQRSNKEVMEMLVAGEENRYVRKLISLICRFISNFKVNGFNADEFNRMYHSTQNVRSRLFLDICHDCYLEYDRWLKENNAVDFEDMINESARLLREVKEMKQKLDFKYVIVDEYQDISRQRFDLTKALSEVSIIEWLIKEHYMLKTKEKYPVLHSTYEGLHYSETITEGKLKKLKKYLEEEVVLWT